ncbi:hypothetical protein [Neorhizobium sp. T25_27]|nr:hypothetical protein [Neorhizobium sp. T25_27]
MASELGIVTGRRNATAPALANAPTVLDSRDAISMGILKAKQM